MKPKGRGAAVRLLKGAVRGYQLLLSPILPPACRYEPSCSAYAIEALETHGAARGSWLTVRRLCRCHPWGGQGYDPVPPATQRRLRATRVRR
jgi:putative membrane protein insertion efficiency factor